MISAQRHTESKKNPMETTNMQPLTDEPLYTVRESSELTGLAYWTIWDLLKRGRLMRTKVGGQTRIRRSELLKLIVDEKS